MRKGQLIKKVLKAYKHHIKYIQDNLKGADMDEVVEYVHKHNISHGICLYICYTLGDSYTSTGYRAKWVGKYGNVWGRYPSHANTRGEVLKLLQLRVDRMERELRSGDKLQQRLDSKQYLV